VNKLLNDPFYRLALPIILAASVVIAFLFGRGCDEPVEPLKPTVEIVERTHTDTVTKRVVVQNNVYIPVATPTLNTSERATLDTVIHKDSASASLHVEYNKVAETYENVMAAFTVPVVWKELTKFVDREIRTEIPYAVPAPSYKTAWFGYGSVFGLMLGLIGYLLFR
jgi:hypothetical protein